MFEEMLFSENGACPSNVVRRIPLNKSSFNLVSRSGKCPAITSFFANEKYDSALIVEKVQKSLPSELLASEKAVNMTLKDAGVYDFFFKIDELLN